EAVPHLGQREGGEVILDEELEQVLATSETWEGDGAVSTDESPLVGMLTRGSHVVAEDAPIVLELKDVAIEYPKQGRQPAFRAVEDASLLIRKGEIVGLVGESGSGKTTIGRAATGLLPVAEGSLTVDGIELRGASRTTLNKVRKDVGMV